MQGTVQNAYDSTRIDSARVLLCNFEGIGSFSGNETVYSDSTGRFYVARSYTYTETSYPFGIEAVNRRIDSCQLVITKDNHRPLFYVLRPKHYHTYYVDTFYMIPLDTSADDSATQALAGNP